MKILIVSDYLDKIGGIESYIHNLKKVLENEGNEVKLFGKTNISKKERILGIIFSYKNIFYAKKFKKEIKKFKPDIIWFHSVSRFLGPEVIKQVDSFDGLKLITYHDLGYFSLFANEIYKESQIPKIFSFLEFIKKSNKGKLFFPYSIFKYLKLKKLKKILNKNIDIHICPSNFVKKYIISQNRGKKVEVLPNFILKEQISQRKEIYQDKINFIFFGRLEIEKGVGLLISFLANLQNLKFKDKKKYNYIISNIRFFVFGDGKMKKILLETFQGTNLKGEDIGIIKDLSTKEKISNFGEYLDKDNKFVYFFGQRDYNEIKEFLSFSHFNLVPSLLLETFGLSAAEGCANGVVNIGLNKENINSFILNKYLIKNTEEFSTKLFNIINNFELEEWKKDSIKSKNLVKSIII